jgi:hypothetical protein
VAWRQLCESDRAQATDDVDTGEALVARGGVRTQVAGDVAAVPDVLQPPLGPLPDRGASIDVDSAAVELVTQGAESLSSFAPCGCGDGAADTLPGGGIAPDLEDGEPLPIVGALEDRPLAVTSPTRHDARLRSKESTYHGSPRAAEALAAGLWTSRSAERRAPGIRADTAVAHRSVHPLNLTVFSTYTYPHEATRPHQTAP